MQRKVTALDLLAVLRRAGLVVRYDLDKRTFEVSPPGRLQPEDIAAIQAVKDDLRELLFEELELPDWDCDELYDPREPAIVVARRRRR